MIIKNRTYTFLSNNLGFYRSWVHVIYFLVILILLPAKLNSGGSVCTQWGESLSEGELGFLFSSFTQDFNKILYTFLYWETVQIKLTAVIFTTNWKLEIITFARMERIWTHCDVCQLTIKASRRCTLKPLISVSIVQQIIC